MSDIFHTLAYARGRETFLMEDENPKGKVKFLKGVEFPKGGQIS
jgi:hypothetical protein